jgi:uncharacterized protein
MTRFLRRFGSIVFVAALLLIGFKLYAQIPSAPDNYIYDGAGIISDADRQTILQLISELDRKTTAQVAVVTVPTTEPDAIETFAVNLFAKWGIGRKGKDNGVLFLVAKNDHKMRIEVGYGLEGALPDAICNRIINAIVVPEFKQSNFSVGVLKGTAAIVSLVAKEYNVAVTGDENEIYSSVRAPNDNSSIAVLIVIAIILFFFFMPLFFPSFGSRRSSGYWYGGGSGGFGGGGFSGGGFGGFGGGMSGGGGSSGGW